MDHIGDFLRSKQPGNMDDNEQNAKMQVLAQLLQLAQGKMGDDIKGMKQVTVAAPDKPGLDKGLDVAKAVTGNADADAAAAADDDSDSSDDDQDAPPAADPTADPAAPAAPGGDDMLGDLKPDEIDALIQALQAKKAALSPSS